MRVAKSKALISCAATAQLISVLFSHMQNTGFLIIPEHALNQKCSKCSLLPKAQEKRNILFFFLSE